MNADDVAHGIGLRRRGNRFAGICRRRNNHFTAACNILDMSIRHKKIIVRQTQMFDVLYVTWKIFARFDFCMGGGQLFEGKHGHPCV